jgi:hypothetical protein
MTNEELVELIAQKSGLDTADAEKALRAVLEQISETLSRDDSVTFPGFGTLRSGERSGLDAVFGAKPSVPVDDDLWGYLSSASKNLLVEAEELGRSHQAFEGQIETSRRKLREIAEQV